MAFWKAVGKMTGKIIKDGISSAQNTMEESKTLQEKYKNYDDKRLKNILHSGKTVEKMAATQILKKRGYGSQD